MFILNLRDICKPFIGCSVEKAFAINLALGYRIAPFKQIARAFNRVFAIIS
jgi:hypothetical protein